MNPLIPPKVKVSGFALVRGPDGKPKVDDPKNLHPKIVEMLSEDEAKELGIAKGKPNGTDNS